MTPELKREIDKYLSKTNPYYSRFSQELKDFLEKEFPTLPTIKARWTLYKQGLTEDDIPTCLFPNCKKKVNWNKRKNKFNHGCCLDHNKRITSLKNFGTEHPNQNKKQLEKVKKSVREKYGVDYVTQTEEHNKSRRATNLKKYGSEEVTSSTIIRDKIKKTNLEKFGKEHPLSHPDVREKIRKTNLERFGVESSLSSPKVREKINKTNLNKYGSIFPMRNEELLEKRRNNIIEKYDSYSAKERKDNSFKYYHLDKSIEAENNNKTYYHFFVSEILKKQKQISWIKERIILKSVGLLEFKDISYEESTNFIEENSLYSNDSEIRQFFGIYSGSELVGIVSGCDKTEYYEITRFVTKIGYNFLNNPYKEFLKYIKIDKPILITFERRFTPIKQPLLEEAGFEFIGGTEPTMFYVNDCTIINSTHKRLLKTVDLKDFKKEWDCGKLVFKKF